MELCETCLCLSVKSGTHTGRSPWHFKRGVSDLRVTKKHRCCFTELQQDNAKKVMSCLSYRKPCWGWCPLLLVICLSVPLLSILENTKVGDEEGRGGAWDLVTRCNDSTIGSSSYRFLYLGQPPLNSLRRYLPFQVKFILSRSVSYQRGISCEVGNILYVQ